MRKSGLFSLAVVSLLATLYACALDPGADPPRTEAKPATLGNWTPEDPSEAVSTLAAPDASPTQDAIKPASGCSVVQYCNAPGSDGTRCLQQGCSLTAAQDECTVESKSVCGTPVCPWVFVALDGTRFINSSCL